ncbi:MAG: hypothetical protein ACOC0P_06755, partial [Planctomycetota bacterium]
AWQRWILIYRAEEPLRLARGRSGTDIAPDSLIMRLAERPEGPWSAAIRLETASPDDTQEVARLAPVHLHDDRLNPATAALLVSIGRSAPTPPGLSIGLSGELLLEIPHPGVVDSIHYRAAEDARVR